MTVSYDFSGRTALVTGASKGIGRRIAERLRDGGAQVWAWDTAPRHLDGVDSVEVDVTNAEEVAPATQRVIDQTSRLDILVNNAGLVLGCARTCARSARERYLTSQADARPTDPRA